MAHPEPVDMKAKTTFICDTALFDAAIDQLEAIQRSQPAEVLQSLLDSVGGVNKMFRFEKVVGPAPVANEVRMRLEPTDALRKGLAES